MQNNQIFLLLRNKKKILTRFKIVKTFNQTVNNANRRILSSLLANIEAKTTTIIGLTFFEQINVFNQPIKYYKNVRTR